MVSSLRCGKPPDGPDQSAKRTDRLRLRRRRRPHRPESYRRSQARLAEVERRLKANLRVCQIGAVTEDLFADENRPLLEERRELQAALKAAAPMPATTDLDFPADLDSLLVGIRAQSPDTQVALLRRLFERIELHGDALLFAAAPEGDAYPVSLPPRWEPQKGVGEEKFLLKPLYARPNIFLFKSR